MKLLYQLLFFILLLIYCPESFPQNHANRGSIDEIFGTDLEIYFRFQAMDKFEVNEISKILSIDNVKPDMMVYTYANRKEFGLFLEMGIDYELLPHPGDYHGIIKMLDEVDVRNITAWDFYPTYEGYIEMMNQFASEYPDLCRIINIGTTYEGRELLVANISDNVGIQENEPEFLYTSSIHGDETTGYVLMLRLIDYLLSNYGNDPRLTDMVNNIDLYINPLANPDGTYWAGNNSVNGARRYNALGVDLNRNYPDPDDGPHPDGNPWQVETVAFMDFAESRDFVAGANFHGGAEVCNYPWDTWEHLAADDAWWKYVCREYVDTVHEYAPSGYLTDLNNGITNGYAWYTITGGRQDYMNYFHQCREFTLEISETKLLPPGQLPAFWEYNYRSLLNYIEQSTFGVRGTVKDATTGWPVAAEVYVLLHEADSSWVYSTLPTGNYHRLLAEGTYTLRFSAPGYETEFRNNVIVTKRQATVLDVLLSPSTGVGGLGNSPINRRIDIYPNPVSEQFLTISSDLHLSEITVYNPMGQEIRKFMPDSAKARLDLGDLTNGVYYLIFNTDKGLGVKKMIISR